MNEQISGILITGTIGSGKTAIATEIGRLMETFGRPAAIIDLDWLGWMSPLLEGMSVDDLITRNLMAVWPGFVSAGAEFVVVVRAIERREQVDAIRNALPDVRLTTIRLTASAATIQERLSHRDTGVILAGHLSQSTAMAVAQDEADLEDLSVENEDRPISEVARDLLAEVGWIN